MSLETSSDINFGSAEFSNPFLSSSGSSRSLFENLKDEFDGGLCADGSTHLSHNPQPISGTKKIITSLYNTGSIRSAHELMARVVGLNRNPILLERATVKLSCSPRPNEWPSFNLLDEERRFVSQRLNETGQRTDTS